MATTNPPTSFKVISVIALIWNAIGIATYIMQVTMSEETLAAMAEPERELYTSIPAWATAAYALAVHTGTLASVGLLLRKAWAVPLFAVSLVCILIQMGHALFMTNLMDIQGPGAAVFPLVLIAIAVFLLLYARSAKTKGWIG